VGDSIHEWSRKEWLLRCKLPGGRKRQISHHHGIQLLDTEGWRGWKYCIYAYEDSIMKPAKYCLKGGVDGGMEMP
jgi:hypothetical protein